MQTLRDFEIAAIDTGDDLVPALAGKVVLAVNVASRCGLTPQYAGLEGLQRELGDQGFTVVGFPCNQFAGQEPGTEAEILEFCQANYDVSFPLTRKVEVNGANRHPVYAWLTGDGDDIEWNFEKFLIDREGRVVRRYPPATPPDDKGLLQDVAELL